MFKVSVKDEVCFYLRILLLQMCGATSFEQLRSFYGMTYETLKGAAAATVWLEFT